MSHYEKPPELYDGCGCTRTKTPAAVRRACSKRSLDCARMKSGSIRPYAGATAAVASYLDVPPDRVTLVNGLDEGIMAAAVAYLRADAGGPVLEAIVPEPAFEIFRFDTAVAGGTLVQVMPHPDFSFPLAEVLAAITPNTRVVFLTNPNNPTGVGMPLEAIRAIAHAVPPGAIVFVDEAYAEFARRHLHPRTGRVPERDRGADVFKGVRPGRPAHRLPGRAPGDDGRHPQGGAGLQRQHRGGRGDSGGAPGSRSPGRLPAPGRRIEGAALRGVRPARHQVLEEPLELRARLRRRSDRRDRERRRSPSGSICRDRSTEPGCAGCLRMATGIVDHTRRAIAVMEEVLCAAP
jgi:histidinol-phosphate aminotransferase